MTKATRWTDRLAPSVTTLSCARHSTGSTMLSRRVRGRANFYEKALFVKPTWRLVSVAECNGLECPSRAMLLSALPRSHTLLSGSVHLMRSVLSSYQGGAAIFRAVSPHARGWTEFACAVASLDPKRYLGLKPWRVATRPPF
jgi:hypothetical protein